MARSKNSHVEKVSDFGDSALNVSRNSLMTGLRSDKSAIQIAIYKLVSEQSVSVTVH